MSLVKLFVEKSVSCDSLKTFSDLEIEYPKKQPTFGDATTGFPPNDV